MDTNLPLINIEELTELLVKKSAVKQRVIIAIAGPPASGKSYLAKTISKKLNFSHNEFSSIFPLDGFHYDNAFLISSGLLKRKGAIQTFDFGGFYHTLKRLYERDEKEVAVPVFDRELEISRGSARLIYSKTPIIIVEGNYLLINIHPWSKLKKFFDIKIFLNVPKKIIHKRLIDRWKHYKISTDEIDKKLNINDIPNANFINSESFGADYLMTNG